MKVDEKYYRLKKKTNLVPFFIISQQRAELASEKSPCLVRKRENVQGPVDFKGIVNLVYTEGSKFEGLKRRLIEPRLRRGRLVQRRKESGLRKWMLRRLGRTPIEPARLGVPVEGKKTKKKGKRGKGALEENREIEVKAQVEVGETWDNRYYLAVEIGGKRCRALYDPGVTCSLIGPGLTKHFAKLLRPTNSCIHRAFDGGTRKVKGILPVTFELESREAMIESVETITQEVLLGADFEIAMSMFVCLGFGTWQICDSELWYRFDNVTDRSEESPVIKEKVAKRSEVLSLVDEKETRIAGMEDWICCFTYKSKDERVNELSGRLRGVKEEKNACKMNECVCVSGENVKICSLENLYVKFYMCYVILVFSVYRSNMRRPYPRGRRHGSGENRPEPEFMPPGDYVVIDVTALGRVEREEFQPNRSSTPSDLSSTNSERKEVVDPSSVPMDLSQLSLPPSTERRSRNSPLAPAYLPITVRERLVSLSSDSVEIVMETDHGDARANGRRPRCLRRARSHSPCHSRQTRVAARHPLTKSRSFGSPRSNAPRAPAVRPCSRKIGPTRLWTPRSSVSSPSKSSANGRRTSARTTKSVD